MEMSELKAGEEMDRVVAEQVMQMVPCSEWGLMSVRSGSGSMYMRDVNACSHGLHGCYPAQQVPGFSSAPYWAMQVVEKMRNSQRWCCIDIHSDYNYVWRIRLVQAKTDDSHEETAAVSSESLPEAICLVALKALEAVKNETVTD